MLQSFSKRDLFARTLDVTGCGRALRAVGAWDGILILNYHRVGDSRHSLFDRNLWSATDQDFDQQMGMIAKQFDVIGLPDFERALRERRGRYVMVTFDDGYCDNYTNAFPILKRHGVPATFFLTTGFLDSQQVPWWDEIAWMVRTTARPSLEANRWVTAPLEFDEPNREVAIRRLLNVYKGLPDEVTDSYLSFLATTLQTGRCQKDAADGMWMTWDMIREMQSNGMTFGGHTVTHPVLANQSSAQQDWEVGECKRRLVEELGESIEAFSYPVGGRSSFNAFTRAALAKHGFRWGFSYIGGRYEYGSTDPFAINRAAIELDVTPPMFRAITTLPQFFA